MKIVKTVASLFFVCISFADISGQDIIQPEAPVLEYVTVNPVNNVVTLRWSPSPSSDVTRYVVYTYANNTADAIDTINDPNAVSYVDIYSKARFRSISYVVAAMDAAKNISPLSNYLSTIYVTTQTDTCNNRINIGWTKCINDRHPAKEYIISCSIDGSASVAIDTADIDAVTYTINGYLPDSEYCFYLTAGSDEETVSVSNRQCAATGSQHAPAWTGINAIRIERSGITITGSFDPDSDITKFIAEKNDAGVWKTVDTGTGTGGSVVLSDINGDTATINLYHIAAINNCSGKVAISETVRNIVLSSSTEGTDIILRWNNPFVGEPALFTIHRNIGNGFEVVATGLTDTLFIDDYPAFAASVATGIIVYRVSGTRYDALPGTVESLSSAAQEQSIENIMAANAFTPDGDGRNDSFAPSLSFTPRSYEFTVMNRNGVVLFRTLNPGEGWDGHYHGSTVAAGAYLWTLVVKTPSGRSESRSGTVTLLP